MSAVGNPVRQKRAAQRARPFAALQVHPNEVVTARNVESRPFFQTMNQEAECRRFDSQQFLELVKYGSINEDSVKKANKYLEDFKTTIDSQGKGLAAEISRQKAQLSSREMGFLDHFGKAYLPIHDNAQMLEEQLKSDASISPNLLHERSSHVLVGAAALIERLHKSSRELEKQQVSYTVDTDWQEDTRKIRHILDSGRQLGEQKMAEISQLLYDRHNRPAGDLTWDQAVRKQEKAVMRLVSTLPLE